MLLLSPTILFSRNRVVSSFSCVLVAAFAILAMAVSARSQTYKCLPDEVKTTDIVRVVALPSRSNEGNVKKISVRETLKQLRAKCVKGKLVDAKRKEIKFFRIEGCWGNPPEDYLEIQARQREALAELKKKYTVVEMSCNTGGRPPQSIN